MFNWFKQAPITETASIMMSFNDLNWECGHTGPAACVQCFRDVVDERNRLQCDITALRERINNE